MQNLFLVAATLVILLSNIRADEEKDGYIFTSPRSLKIDNNNELQFRRFGNSEAGTLTVRLYYAASYGDNETLALENKYEIAEGKRTSFLNLHLNKMDTNAYSGRIQINGTFGDYVIGGGDRVYFSTPKKNVVFIQTDKPLYKPGQEVKFRVLKLNNELKPSGKEKDVAEVYIEDPKGTRLFQWKDVHLGKGIVQKEFPLSDEPTLGSWKITVSTPNYTESNRFEVKEYVLPKFEVKINFPSFVLADAKVIPVEICAKYTYGKPVVGTLNINSSLEKYSWSSEKIPVLEESVKINGCYKYDLNVSLVEPSSTYRYRRIMVSANVVEEGTGVDRNETQYLQRQYSPLNIQFNTNARQYFKPGLPYRAKIEVTNPDNTPAAGEEIELCSTMTRERVIAEWWATRKSRVCKNFTTDDHGKIHYNIPPQNVDTVSIILEAKSTKYAKKSGASGTNLLDQPRSSMSLSPFYSPSGSFIQMAAVEKAVPCDEKKSVKLLFTSKEEGDYKFYYQVLRQGKVLRSGSVETTFSASDDVSSEFEKVSETINGDEVQILPAKKTPNTSSSSSAESAESDCPAAKGSKYLPPIGSVSIPIDVDASMSPSVYLLVYYVRGDRETVADSQKIEVEKCFKNKVDFEFGDETKQPGTKTTVSVSASPNSLCGVKVVDKSISLLDNSNDITKDTVFQVLDSLDTGYYYSSNPCYENKPQPGLYASASRIRPPTPVSSSSYEDSLTAFQNTGSLLISDLIVLTRPCQSSDYDNRPVYQTESMAFSAGGAGAGPPIALASVSRRPAAPAAAMDAADAKVGNSIAPTKSAVDIRDFFPETWLFDIEKIDETGKHSMKARLPHTITEWQGSAICVSGEDGLGISNVTAIRGFQAFFISYTLPPSVIRGEEFWVVVSVFSYADGALPISVSLDDPEGLEVTSDSINGDICVQPDTSQSLRMRLKATKVEKVNITVRAESAQNSEACSGSGVSSAVAKDAITQSLDVHAEGYPTEKVENSLFCPTDNENQTFTNTFELEVPEDIVPDSSRVTFDVTGNIMGPAIDNLDRLVALPTGCGEQNIVKFAPNYIVLDYLTDIGQLTDAIKTKAIRNLNTGYQRELTYKHDDGSFSAFGKSDREGSMFLTAYVLQSFSEARRYIAIDKTLLTGMQEWIVGKQQEDGCFADVGKVIDSGLQGGIEKEKAPATVTAYVVASLIISDFENQTVLDSAMSCVNADSDLTPYQKALYAYANALSGNTKEAKALLGDLRELGNQTNGVEYFNNINGSKSINIETAAYTVLTTLALGGTASDALPIVRYMTSNLNPRGGFYSTQDTCVGLNALGRFAKMVYKDPVDIMVSTSGGLSEKIVVSEDNKLVVQRRVIKAVPSRVDVEATGSGCALIQTTLRYNTVSPPKDVKFSLVVNGECLNAECKNARIQVATNYLPENKKSGMSVVEVNMVSGYVPVKESLEKLKGDKDNQVMRYDVENNVVQFYFNEITNVGKRFSFEVEEVIAVDNAQPANVNVYDYYAPENSAKTSYKISAFNEA